MLEEAGQMTDGGINEQDACVTSQSGRLSYFDSRFGR